jgi:hypothetical protein
VLIEVELYPTSTDATKTRDLFLHTYDKLHFFGGIIGSVDELSCILHMMNCSKLHLPS